MVRAVKYWRRSRASGGQGTVEAALVLPVLLLLVFSFIDFSTVLFGYLALQNGVAFATRFAVTGRVSNDPNAPGTQLSREASIRLALRQATPSFVIQDADVTFYNVTKNIPGAGGRNDVITVRVTHQMPLISPLVSAFSSSGYFTVQASSTMRNEPF
jgi:Flp pilus assembly protein TadG